MVKKFLQSFNQGRTSLGSKPLVWLGLRGHFSWFHGGWSLTNIARRQNMKVKAVLRSCRRSRRWHDDERHSCARPTAAKRRAGIGEAEPTVWPTARRRG